MASNWEVILTPFLSGFKSIKSEVIEIKDLNILIGANGAGKSNFIAVFRLLRQIVEKRLRATVLEEGGAERLLHYVGGRP